MPGGIVDIRAVRLWRVSAGGGRTETGEAAGNELLDLDVARLLETGIELSSEGSELRSSLTGDVTLSSETVGYLDARESPDIL